MTIDEAIAQARDISDKNSNCWIKCRSKLCKECMQEHDQIAEWLEELKALRHEANEWRKAGYSHGYNKAIDDFITKLEEHLDNLLYPQNYIKEFIYRAHTVAEHLKAGK